MTHTEKTSIVQGLIFRRIGRIKIIHQVYLTFLFLILDVLIIRFDVSCVDFDLRWWLWWTMQME
jgi:hypothetical protein